MSNQQIGRSAGQPPQSNVTMMRGYVLPKRAGRYEPVEVQGQSAFRKWIVPGALLGIGAAGLVLAIQNRGSLGLLQFTGYAIGGILFAMISLFLGLLAMARLMGAELDTVAATAWKLLAIAIFCGAIAALIAGIDKEEGSVRGMIVALHVVLLLYFTCFTFLFQLDLLDGLTAAVISLIIQAGLILTVAQALPMGAAKLML